MMASGCPEDLMAAVQAIIQQHQIEQRHLTEAESRKLLDCALQLINFNDECFAEYKIQFCHLLNEASKKAIHSEEKFFYYALMTEFRLYHLG